MKAATVIATVCSIVGVAALAGCVILFPYPVIRFVLFLVFCGTMLGAIVSAVLGEKK